jgi:hypothetical protein
LAKKLVGHDQRPPIEMENRRILVDSWSYFPPKSGPLCAPVYKPAALTLPARKYAEEKVILAGIVSKPSKYWCFCLGLSSVVAF